jgi:hypothetical protein
MDFIEATVILQQLHYGFTPSFIDKLDTQMEGSDKENIQSICSGLSELICKKDKLLLAIRALSLLESIEKYQKWVEHPIYLNEFKDKKGNTYLQARTSLKDERGKTKWVNAYIGSLKEYPKGVNDPNAMEKAKPLIRSKLKKYFGLK